MTSIELLANQIVEAAVKEQENIVDLLVDLFNEANMHPEQLSMVQNHTVVGNAFLLMLAYDISSNEESLQQIAGLAYLFLTKATERDPANINIIKNRVVLLYNAQQYLTWVVINAMGRATSAQSILGHMSPQVARGILLKMVLSDLEGNPSLMQIADLIDIKAKIYQLISNGSFGASATRVSLSKEGYEAHKKLLYYLHDMVVNDRDLDF
jgi:hypothetical protein